MKKKSRTQTDRKISIVTGASSGLGREIAILLSEKGHAVYAVARRNKDLFLLKKEMAKNNGNGPIIPVAGDLTNRNFREFLIKKVLRESKKIDYLINNAGYGKLIEFKDIELKDIEGIFSLNVIASQHLAQLALPSMRKRKSGRIINIASVVSFVPPAYFATYNASKAAVHNFTKSLSYELVGSGVSTSTVFPARMDTPFWLVAFKCRGLTGQKQKLCVQEYTKVSTKPRKVAKYIVRHLNDKSLMILPGFLPKFYYYIVSHVPFINSLVAKYITGPKTKKMLQGKT